MNGGEKKGGERREGDVKKVTAVREGERGTEQGSVPLRQRKSDRYTNTYDLARTTLRMASQSVAGAHVQAFTFKALAGSTPQNLHNC